MTKRYNHSVWANLESFNISFVDRNAMELIATTPVREDGVVWLPEALNQLWDATDGHPWVVQHIAEKITERLNGERRRLVGPSDVTWASEEIVRGKDNVGGLWWNEDDGQVTETHRRIAFLLLQSQPATRKGLRESQLSEICQRAGIKYVGRYLEEMKSLEVLTEEKSGEDYLLRIRGGFLESYLAAWMRRTTIHAPHKPPKVSANEPLALMVDHENVKIRLLETLKSLPTAKAEASRPLLNGSQLADRLLKSAARYGNARQRWAVANWEHDFFRTDQRPYRAAGYGTDMSGDTKADASDHVLKEKIHWVLREVSEIEVFIIATGDGDYIETVKTLQEKGKQVVLWATQNSLSRSYMERLKGPDPIQIEWLEDLVFGITQPASQTSIT
jgi:hypothetical protein